MHWKDVSRVWFSLALLVSAAPVSPAPYHSHPGAIHVHTAYSDGSGTFQDLADAARATGLSYIITTDHNTLAPLRDGHQRYWGPVLVLIGTEISTDAGHYLALDLPAGFQWNTRDPQRVIDRVNAAGGFGILAHPVSERWPWTDWGVHGYAGMEVINLASLMDADLRAVTQIQVPARTLRELTNLAQRYLRDPDGVMARFTDNTVDADRAQWDGLLRRGRQVVGTAGVDAHARIPIGGTVFRVPTYQEAFESVQTYAVTPAPLSGDAGRDRAAIYGAYRNGRLYLVYPRVAAAPRFRFTAHEGAREATMGQPIRLERSVRLVVESPGHAHPLIRLLRDGSEIAAAEEGRLEWSVTQPGAYRVEVYGAERAGRLFDIRRGLRLPSVGDIVRSRRRELRPWIFSNPIYVRSEGQPSLAPDPFPERYRRYPEVFDWRAATPDELRQKLGILSAYHLPGGHQGLYPTISPVNSFRVVLNRCFGEDLPLLPDRSYAFQDESHLYRFRDVTDIVRKLDPPAPARTQVASQVAGSAR